MNRTRITSKASQTRENASTSRAPQGRSPNKGRRGVVSTPPGNGNKRQRASSSVMTAALKIARGRSCSSYGANAKQLPFFVTSDGLVLGEENWAKIREGYAISALKVLSEHIAMSPAGVLESIGVSKSTALRRTGQAQLKPQESEKVYQIAKVVALADQVFADHEKSLSWLQTPNRALVGDTPFSRLDTAAGADEVTQLLQRIDYGVYS